MARKASALSPLITVPEAWKEDGARWGSEGSDADSHEGQTEEQAAERDRQEEEFNKTCEKRWQTLRRQSVSNRRGSVGGNYKIGSRALRETLLRKSAIASGLDPNEQLQNSIGYQRFDAIDKKLGEDFMHETEVERYTNHGLLIDFLCRLNRKTMKNATPGSLESSHPHEHIARIVNPSGCGAPQAGSIQWKSYVDAIEAVNCEMLYSSILEDVTIFWKAQKHPDWQLLGGTGAEHLRHHMREIHSLKQEAHRISTAVENWNVLQGLLASKVTSFETQQERHQRHQEFWAQFHEVPRKMEVRKEFVGKTPSSWLRKQPSGEVDASESPAASRQPSPAASRQASPAGTQAKGLEVKSRPGHDLDWKRRPGRSRCTAGAWDWSRGVSERGSPMGSRASTRGSQGSTSRGSAAEGLGGTTEPVPSGKWKFDDAPDFPSEHASDGRPRTSPTKPASHRWWQQHQPDPAPVSSFVIHHKGMATASLIGMSLSKTKSLPSLPGRVSPRRAVLSPLECGELPEFARNAAPLPPISSASTIPWHGKSPVPTLKCEDTPTKRYLQHVAAGGCLPRPLPFITGHSLKFAAGNEDSQSIFDKDLLAVAEMVPAMQIEEVDLEGNMLLTEKALLKFIRMLADCPAAESLKHLNLRRCTNAGQLVADVIVKMIANPTTGCHHLKSLNLSSIPLGSRRCLPLCTAVGLHPTLGTVSLADIGLGSSPEPGQCIDYITGNKQIETLNLGWNCFGEDEFELLGERIVEMGSLKNLEIPSCSAICREGHASPVASFVETLNRCKSLRKLDVSLNRIDFRGALVLEDALELNKTLTQLNVSDNPLGVLGMRSLLRLLVRTTSGLTQFCAQDCSTGDSSEMFEVFSFDRPVGRYNLDLSRTYHRSILRMLYKTSERYGIQPSDAFADLKATPAYSHATKGDCSAWLVPRRGTLQLTFQIDKALDVLTGFDDWTFAAFLEAYFHMIKVRPCFHKVVPLMSMWKKYDGVTNEQMCILLALSKDFALTYPLVEQMAQSRSLVAEIIVQLMPCIQGGQISHFLTMLLHPSLGQYVATMKKNHNLVMLNVENPNAHYKLDLENNGDHMVASKLLLIDRWETTLARRLGRVDTSQKGNWSQIRNESYQCKPLRLASMHEWHMPEFDELEFDYSSGKRPPLDAMPIDELTFANMMVTLQNSDCSPLNQITALKAASHMIYVKSVQMRGLLGIYAEKETRIELFVIFFLRVVDFYNEKVYRVRFDDEAELVTLSDRIGWVTLFPFIQPEQATFTLDFSVYDQKLAANILMTLNGKESGHNLRDPVYLHEDGTIDPLGLGIPRSWEAMDKMPKEGQITMTYVCSPEDRSYATRRGLYEKYGYRIGVPESDIMWWAALNAAPEDVVEYLSFIVAKYSSTHEAFVAIDGDGGNGVISLQEFREGYAAMECQKFKGPDEQQRILDIFRYLDPSGEGTVSEPEWNILDLLWQEIRLSITEFVRFCERTFGDDLAATWVFFDEDGGGEIDEAEWLQSCQAVGFFGPTKPIFGFLDADDEGTVSLGEFKQLEEFQAPPEERFHARMALLHDTGVLKCPSPIRTRENSRGSLASRDSFGGLDGEGD